MTPKEKARELRNKMYLKMPSIYDPTMLLHYPIAKEMALIAVDQIIENFISKNNRNYLCEEIDYWQEVKQEIEKL